MIFTNPKNLAKQLGVSTGTIRQLCQKGDIPAIRVGGQYRILQNEFEGWVDSHGISPKAKPAPRVQAMEQLQFPNLPGFRLVD